MTTEAKLRAALAALVETSSAFRNDMTLDVPCTAWDSADALTAALLAAKQVLAETGSKCDVCESPLVDKGPTCADCLKEAAETP